MHSCVCGINLRSESSLVSRFVYISRKIGLPEFDRNVFIARKVTNVFPEH